MTENNLAEQNPVSDRIINIIRRSPEKFFSNKELAEKLDVSVKTAENKFKSTCGITIHQYILKFKAEQAVSYFKNFPEMQIKEVAYNLGFYDEYHFSKQFKKVMGVSPTEYRNNFLK
jgi:AraC-like DNA-binding protein